MDSLQSRISNYSQRIDTFAKHVETAKSKAMLPMDTLATLQATIKNLNEEMQSTKLGLSQLSKVYDSEIAQKESALKGIKFKVFNRSKVADLKREIARLRQGSSTVSQQLRQLEQIQSKAQTLLQPVSDERFAQSLALMPHTELQSEDRVANQIIQHYQVAVGQKPEQFSDEQRLAIAKAVIIAVKTGIMLEGNLLTVEVGSRHHVVHFSQSGSATVGAFLGEGIDAKVFHSPGDTALKVAKPEADTQIRIQQEIRTQEQLTSFLASNPDLPTVGVTEFRGVTVLGTGEQALMERFYDKGGLDSHVRLQKFASSLAITDEMLLELEDPTLFELQPHAMNRHTLVDRCLSQAGEPLSRCLDELLAEIHEADKTVTKDELLTKLVRQLKTEYVPFSPPERWQMSLQLVHGALIMAGAGVIHGDIKPGNIRWTTGHFAHGDFGTAVDAERIRGYARLAAQFSTGPRVGFAGAPEGHKEKTKVHSVNEQNIALRNIVENLHTSSAKGKERTIDSFDGFVAMLKLAGIVSEKNEVVPAKAAALGFLCKTVASGKQLTAKQLSEIERLDPGFLKDCEDAGFMRRDGASFVLAANISEKVQEQAVDFFKFLSLPANTFVGTQAYSSPADEEWINYQAHSGDAGSLLDAIESQQTYSLGATIIESITGARPERMQTGPSSTAEGQAEIRRNLTTKGMSSEFCDVVVEMIRDQGVDPNTLVSKVRNSNKFTQEQKRAIEDEVQKVKRREISADSSEILRGAALMVDIDPTRLTYTPRKPLMELYNALRSACPHDLA